MIQLEGNILSGHWTVQSTDRQQSLAKNLEKLGKTWKNLEKLGKTWKETPSADTGQFNQQTANSHLQNKKELTGFCDNFPDDLETDGCEFNTQL